MALHHRMYLLHAVVPAAATKMKHRLLYSVLPLACILIFIAYFIYKNETQKKSQIELSQIYQSLFVGMNLKQAEAAFEGLQANHLAWFDRNEETVEVRTPDKLGSMNQVLFLHFQNNELVGYYVATGNSMLDRPSEYLQDQGVQREILVDSQ